MWFENLFERADPVPTIGQTAAKEPPLLKFVDVSVIRITKFVDDTQLRVGDT